MSDPTHTAGQALDRCICVHAEQNAFITAARYGIHVEGASLYTTLNPCFNCLKEAIQAGVKRIVYKNWYPSKYSAPLIKQYAELVHHLTNGDETAFEVVGGGQVAELVSDAPPDPFEDDKESEGLKPEDL
jgi:dCMP deaminase